MKFKIVSILTFCIIASAPRAMAWETFLWCNASDGQNKLVMEKESNRYQVVFRNAADVARLVAFGERANSNGEIVLAPLYLGETRWGASFSVNVFDGQWTIAYASPNHESLTVTKRDWANQVRTVIESVDGCQGVMKL